MTSIRDPYELSQAYFPWLYVGGKFRTEILSRNAIPPPHLKKKKLWEKREAIVFHCIFSGYGESGRGGVCGQERPVDWQDSLFHFQAINSLGPR